MSRPSRGAATKENLAGLDQVLLDRLLLRQNILLLGPPFTGKTTLVIQFLASGLKVAKPVVDQTT